MLKLLICTVSSAGLIAGWSAPSVAQPAPTGQAAQHREISDPNRIICQKQEVIGSRLATKKICKTRAEWADGQLQDQQEINRVQTQRGNAGQFP